MSRRDARAARAGAEPPRDAGEERVRGETLPVSGGVFGNRWRLAARLAERQVRRTKLSSLLVVTLVALPIAAMTAFAVFSASSIGTPQERARVELGAMQAWIAPVSGPDAGLWQVPGEPGWHGFAVQEIGSSRGAGDPQTSDPLAALPPDIEAIPVTGGTTQVETPSGVALIDAWAGKAWDPRFEGRTRIVDGRPPQAADEAMVSPAALERLNTAIGGVIRLADGDGFTVVGTLDAASFPDDRAVVFLPEAAADAVGYASLSMSTGVSSNGLRWYLPDHVLTWEDVRKLNDYGIIALSRDVLLDPPTPDELVQEAQNASQASWMSTLTLLMAMAAGGLFGAYVVVMLAGAAFAVSARRQQRTLAIAASVGAERRDLFRAIVLQGTSLGLAGGVVGATAGVGLGALVLTLTDDGSGVRFWGFHVPWAMLAGILVFAVLVGTASAAVPARTVSRTDVLHALRGARRPQRPRASRPVWGSLVLVSGVVVTITCALALAAVTASTDLPSDSPLRWLPAWGIVIGPILVQIGVLISGRWLLWLVSRPLSRAGIAARLASRDAAASAARTVPVFAAIAATVFLGVFALGQSAMLNAQTARDWFYAAPVGSLSVEISATGETPEGSTPTEAAETAAETARTLAEGAGATRIGTVSRQPEVWHYQNAGVRPVDGRYALALLPEQFLLDPELIDSYRWSGGDNPENNLSVVPPDDLEVVMGVDLSASDLAAYRDGAAIVSDDRYVTDSAIDVGVWSIADAADVGVRSNIWLSYPGGEPAEPLSEERIEAIVVEAPHQPVSIAIAPATADKVGIESAPSRIVGGFDTPPTTAALDRLTAQSTMMGASAVTVWSRYETGPPSSASWMIPLLAVVAVLVIGATAVALGLARFERRPDDATLAAVGGNRAVRRGIGFWQGLIIAGFGTTAGAAAGVLPPIGFAIQSQGTLRLADVPWAVLAALALALPLLIAVANWAVPPRRADLVRRTAIA